MVAATPRALESAARVGVAEDATAVTGNLTVVGQTKGGYVSMTTAPTARPVDLDPELPGRRRAGERRDRPARRRRDGRPRLCLERRGQDRPAARHHRVLPLATTGGVALHQLGHRGPGGGPLGLVAEDVRLGPPAAELGHGRDDEVVGQLPVAAGIELPGHEVAPDGLVRGASSGPSAACRPRAGSPATRRRRPGAGRARPCAGAARRAARAGPGCRSGRRRP